MDAKFQEYLDQISSEKYGDDVRSAIQHALVYIYDRFTRQKRMLEGVSQYANEVLGETWPDVIDLGDECGDHGIERTNLITGDDAKDGYNDMVTFISELVAYLRTFKSVITALPNLSEKSSISDLITAMEYAFGYYYVTEEVRMVTGWSPDYDGSDMQIPFSAKGNLTVIPTGDVAYLFLNVCYIDLVPQMTVSALSKTFPGVDTRPIICLSNTVPPDTVKTAEDFLVWKTGSGNPDVATAITDLSDMIVDTVYRIEGNTGITYPIDITENSVLLDGTVDLLLAGGAKCLVIGQVSRSLTTGKDIYYDGKEISISNGILATLYANIGMSKRSWLNDR